MIPAAKRLKTQEDDREASFLIEGILPVLRSSNKPARLHAVGEILVALETTEEHVTLKIVAGLSAILPLEPSSHVVRRVVKALGLAASRLSDVNIVLRDFDELMMSRPNVLTEILTAYGTIGLAKSSMHGFFLAKILRLIENAQQALPRATDRATALAILSKFDVVFEDSIQQVITICSRLAKRDLDCRVRAAALEALVVLGDRGLALQPALYQSAIFALMDDSEEVRIQAVELLWRLAKLFGHQRVDSTSATAQTMADDAFVKLCSMAGDTSVPIRCRVFALLSQVPDISQKLMLQSLSKNMMKVELERDVDKQKQKNKLEGDPDSHKGEGVVVVDASKLNLIESGSYGAFVHGLEDEFYEVRAAAIESIRELSKRSQDFSAKAVEFLIDMFNDEHDRVRELAVTSLQSVCSSLVVSHDQLITVLSLMNEEDSAVRQASIRLVSVCWFKRPDMFKSAVDKLRMHLPFIGGPFKLRVDLDLTLESLKHLGYNHPRLVELLYEELLPDYVDRGMLRKEIPVEDLGYQAIMILIFNAAANNPVLLALLPRFTPRHYHFLSSKYPKLIPKIPALSVNLGEGTRQETLQQSSQTNQLKMIQDLVKRCQSMLKSTPKPSTWASCESEQHMLATALPDQSELIEYYSNVLKVYYQLLVVVRSARPDADLKSLRHAIQCIDNIYSGVSASGRCFILDIQFLLTLKYMTTKETDEAVPIIQDLINDLIREHQRLGVVVPFSLDPFKPSDEKPIQEVLNSLIESNIARLPVLEVANGTKKLTATIQKPDTNMDRPTIFWVDFPLSLRFEATINNMGDQFSTDIFVRATLMQGKEQYFAIIPDAHHCFAAGPKWLVNMPLTISINSPWSQPQPVELTVVKRVNGNDGVDHVAISSPRSYWIWPKQVR